MKISVIDERRIKDKVIVILQNEENAECKSLILDNITERQYNRNKEQDIMALWNNSNLILVQNILNGGG